MHAGARRWSAPARERQLVAVTQWITIVIAVGWTTADLEISEILFGQPGLLQNLTKRARRESGGVHRHIRLATVSVAKHFVAACLAHLEKPRAEQTGENLTG